MSEIVRKTNFISNNLYAEHLLRQPLAANTSNISIENALTDMKKHWQSKGINCSGVWYNDGCGVSPRTYLTPKHLADILFYMKHKSKEFESFYESLPISGESGTLKSFLDDTPAEGKFKLKSGSYTGVKAYAGYGTTASEREIIVVIITNQFLGKSYTIKTKMEDLLEAVYLYVK